MSQAELVWVVDDDRGIRWVLEKALTQANMNVVGFETAGAALQRLTTERPDVIISDIRMPGKDGMALLSEVQAQFPELPVIIMTAYADLDRAVSAYRGGAFEYLPKPFDVDEAVSIVRRAMRRSEDVRTVPRVETTAAPLPEMVGSAPAMQEVFRAIGRLSRSHVTVLITGESGTGKELVARALHRHSPRASGPFIALNTAAIPRELLESELFGHERGAFTGASSQRIGRFEQANGGTLFLDEIGDMPAELQTRLLRVLSDQEFYRVGGHVSIKADVRVIAATHQDLQQRVRAGAFREDLFHRLNVIRIQLPSLRQRREDIPVLADYFLRLAAQELDVEVKTLRPSALQRLNDYNWPGNVRQLENVCRWLTVMAPSQELHVDDLPAELREPDSSALGADTWQQALRTWADARLANGGEAVLREALPSFERILIETALARAGGHKQDAARLLGWGRNTLTRKMKELKK
jgi:two-component system nitrogen regulation response regulator GlnG